MTVTQAIAVNRICDYLLSTKRDKEATRNALSALARQAHQTLSAGWTADEVETKWDFLQPEVLP